MKKKHEKLIRGIIYDNPNVVEEKAFETADMLLMATERCSTFYNANEDMFKTKESEYLPNKEQFAASVLVDMICNPLPGVENMIIPSDLVDNKLYKDLKRIDIGEQISHAYKCLAVDNYYDKLDEEENKPEEKFNFGIIDPYTGEKVILESDLNREELIERVKGLDNLSDSELAKIINDIKAA